MLKSLLNSPKTSTAGLVFFTVYAVAKLGNIWFPGHEVQFEKTREAIQSLAVFYGMIAAQDGKKMPDVGTNGSQGSPVQPPTPKP
jgi:hypothetical protein